MGRLNFSPEAKRDLDGIWDYTAQRWNAKQADRYVGNIRKVAERVAKNLRLGAACDGIHAGYRKISCGSHIIFYRRAGAGVRILRVLHQSMDLRRRLKS